MSRWHCTPLRRQAHVQVKMWKTLHAPTTFGSWDVEKVQAATVARSTCQVKMRKTRQVRSTSGCWDVEKVHALVAGSTFRSQNVEDHWWIFGCRFAWQAKEILNLPKNEQNVKVLSQLQLQPPLHYAPLRYTTTTTTLQDYTMLH